MQCIQRFRAKNGRAQTDVLKCAKQLTLMLAQRDVLAVEFDSNEGARAASARFGAKPAVFGALLCVYMLFSTLRVNFVMRIST